MSKKIEITGYLLIISAVVIWSLGEIILKIIQNDIGPFAYTFLRMIIGGTFLFSILSIQKDFSGIGKMMKNNLPLMIFACVFGLFLTNILFFIGISNTQANMGSVLCSTSPVWMTIFAFFLLKEKNNLKTKFIGIAVGLIGITILLTNLDFSGFLSSEFLFGNILSLGAEIVWDLFTVGGKKVQINEENTPNADVKFTMLSLLLGSIPAFLVLIFTPEFTTFLNYPLEVWIFIIVLAVVFSAVAYMLFFKGLKEVDTSKGASLVFLKPILSTIFAFIILGETPTIFLIISTILIILSIFIINRAY